jgi:RNA polymerase sigma factor (sigma-70 family)
MRTEWTRKSVRFDGWREVIWGETADAQAEAAHMTASPERLLWKIRLLVRPPAAEPPSDAALLARFVQGQDEDAFAALVGRYGPLVLGICRRVLGDAQLAEDAYQATWLVLARKAASIGRSATLAAWLYGTARRLALKCCQATARRRRREALSQTGFPCRLAPEPLDELSAREVLQLLDEELQRLPEAYRLPILLCGLEGLSQQEAAVRLGWTVGSVKGRLERGRVRLQARLVRRGLTLSAALSTLQALRGAATAGQPVTLPPATTEAALAFAAGKVAADGPVTARAIAAAQGVLKAMVMTKLKAATAVVLALGVAAAGTAALTYAVRAGQPAGSPGVAPGAQAPTPGDKDKDKRERVEKAVQAVRSLRELGQRPAWAGEKANARARREAARKVYEGTLARMKVDTAAVDWDRPCQWSRRWLEADRDVDDSYKGQVAAAKAHLERMKELKALVRKLLADKVVSATDVTAVEYYRLEAERLLAVAEAGGMEGR